MKKSVIQQISIAFAAMTGLFAGVEPILTNGILGKRTDRIAYLIFGVISALLILYYIYVGRLYKKADMWIVFSLFAYAFLTTWSYYGLTKNLFAARFYYIWLTLIFGFFAVRAAQKPYGIIMAFSFTYVLTVCVFGVSILVRATMTLREAIPDSDRIFGCFRVGRLCGMANANTMAFYCMACLMLSVPGCIKGTRMEKIFYGIACAVMWFLLGLNNSRTVNYALALTAAGLVFALIRRRAEKKETKKAVKLAKAAAAACAAALCVVFLMMAPTPIYKSCVSAAAKLSNDRQLQENIDLVYERSITDTNTLTDRSLIWKRSVELIFKDPRRTLFGVSIKSPEIVYGSYEGRHDITMPFAHTMLLEVFRRFGLIGLLAWIWLLCIWGKNALKKYFDTAADIGTVYMMSAAAGILLTGITEMGPFILYSAMGAPYVFFFSCGLAMRNDENEKDPS